MDDDSDITFEIPSGQKVSWTEMERVAKKCAPGDPDLQREGLLTVSLRLLERKRKIDNPGHYVARAIRNTILSLRKRREAQDRSSFSLSDLEESLQDSQQLADDAIITAELFRKIEEALKTETGKQVWTLCLDGWKDQSEIAQKIGRSRQTVNKYIKKIRKIIEEIDPSKVPPSPKGGGGGGRRARKGRGGTLPPARADPEERRPTGASSVLQNVKTGRPLFWVIELDNAVKTTVVSGVEETSIEEVINYEERSKVDTMGRTAPALPSGRQRSGDQRRQRQGRVVGDLKRLLLQLPAFRGNDHGTSQDGEVRNLEDVLGKVLGRDLDDEL